MSRLLRRQDIAGIAVVVVLTAGLLAYRAWFIEPRAWGAICDAAQAPLACLPRQGLLWAQYQYAWGLVALLLGLGAFVIGWLPLAVAAVAMGVAAVVNYNASWGMVAVALGAWHWIGANRRRAV